MCYEIKCAIQYTVDLIDNNINRDVQRIVQTARRMCKHGCTGYVHIKLSFTGGDFKARLIVKPVDRCIPIWRFVKILKSSVKCSIIFLNE